MNCGRADKKGMVKRVAREVGGDNERVRACSPHVGNRDLLSSHELLSRRGREQLDELQIPAAVCINLAQTPEVKGGLRGWSKKGRAADGHSKARHTARDHMGSSEDVLNFERVQSAKVQLLNVKTARAFPEKAATRKSFKKSTPLGRRVPPP